MITTRTDAASPTVFNRINSSIVPPCFSCVEIFGVVGDGMVTSISGANLQELDRCSVAPWFRHTSTTTLSS